ncbi:MAG TPA: branched-chain amino acid ABC transporter permease [Usitatibacter sp.]|nr:branched-chain amino acid ABC transporter permease [Usitatibacter sp.]
MIYRETGQFKTTYASDQQLFPILQDRVFVIAALGLNILVGYCGQVSLGTGGFMAVGAYAAYNFAVRVPQLDLLVIFILAGLCAAAVGVVFGIPSLRIKGFYLAVATLAAQFFIDWAFARIKWFTNDTPSGSVSAPPLEVLGYGIEGPQRKYLLVLAIVSLAALIARNLTRGAIGRSWMATRDMDVAAEVIGIRPLTAKLSAFAVSSFFVGISGALWAFVYLGSWEPLAFDVNRSFQLLFMVIIGGLGSILGSFLGAAFIVILPLVLNQLPAMLGIPLSTAMVSDIEFMVFGALIVFFLIVEPRGLARLWAIAKEKLRLWPFPH